jgi:hypothetical protein
MLCNLDRATVQHLGIGVNKLLHILNTSVCTGTGKPICWLPSIMEVH